MPFINEKLLGLLLSRLGISSIKKELGISRTFFYFGSVLIYYLEGVSIKNDSALVTLTNLIPFSLIGEISDFERFKDLLIDGFPLR
jgi:hypothetical protein